MTSPVGVIGLSYDGYDLQREDLDVLFQITEGLDTLPETRGTDQVIPFRSGQLPQARIAHRRSVVARGWVAGAAPSPETSYRAYLDGLKAVLDPTRAPAILVATLVDGSKRWINARPANPALIGGDLVGHEMRPMSIEWDALDPFWYGSNGVILLDSGLVLDDGLVLDSDAKIVIVPTSTSHVSTFTALGTADIENVVVEIVGPSTGAIDIGNLSVVDGTSSGFSHPALVAGQTLVVDSGNRTARVGGANARGNLVLHSGNRHGEYFRVRPGSNTLSIIGRPAEVRLSFMAAYL